MLQTDITCVVPARLGSTRFPKKLLQPLFGKPVVVHTLERAAEAECFAEVVCFTDSIEIGEAVAHHGFRYVLTGEAMNGTERIGKNLDAIETDLIVNLQGDEPAFPTEGLIRLCVGLRKHPEWVHTLVHRESPTDADIENPNRVKAVLNQNGFVMDFVRAIVPHGRMILRPHETDTSYRIHLGAYGYSTDYLRRYVAAPVSQREIEMSHELMRDLNLAPVRTHAAPAGSPVDVPADLAPARERLETLRTLQGVL